MMTIIHAILSDDATRNAIEAGAYGIALFFVQRYVGSGIKGKIAMGIADAVVGSIYHDYVNDAKDAADSRGEPLSKNLEKQAHKDATLKIADKMRQQGIPVPDRDELDALVVGAVKRTKLGTAQPFVRTKPSTKGM
jgi:hypothetical protein